MTDAAAAIETCALSKHFGKTIAIDQVDLSVARGSVFGFLGLNGAGKTTTIRILVGLARPTSGEVALLGTALRGLEAAEGRVGVLLEQPALYPHLSCAANLEVLSGIGGQRLPRSTINDVLERVGLAGATRTKARACSQGMRQRLALAAAIVFGSELLVLDEPANGLDPAGTRDLIALLRDLKNQGRTIFLSSHMLGDVEQVCDSVCVLRKGSVVFQGSIRELTAASPPGTVVQLERDPAVEDVLTRLGWRHSWRGDLLDIEGIEPEEAHAALAGAGIMPANLLRRQGSLEEAFLRLADGER